MITFQKLLEKLRRTAVHTAFAKKVGDALNVDWEKVDLEQFRRGLETEQEHSDISGNILLFGKIALAHLKEFPDYYSRLRKMEKSAKSDGAAGTSDGESSTTQSTGDPDKEH